MEGGNTLLYQCDSVLRCLYIYFISAEEEKPVVKQWQTSTPSADFTMQGTNLHSYVIILVAKVDVNSFTVRDFDSLGNFLVHPL